VHQKWIGGIRNNAKWSVREIEREME